MKFSTDKPQRNYFYKHGIIEFDGLFNPEQVQDINTSIDAILSKELGVPIHKLARESANQLFVRGHDLWRHNESLKKLILHPRLAETAGELMEVHSMRMGYDQFLVGEPKTSALESDDIYHQFLQSEGTLQNKSCMTPVICGLMLCLDPADSSENSPPLFPKISGSGVYFKADIPLDLTFLSHTKGGRYLLIAYVDPRTVYILNEKDPHTHTLKREGYVFGDRLSDKLNPLIYK